MLTRRAFLGGTAAAAAASSCTIEEADMALPIDYIHVPLTGLHTKVDPKSAPQGLLTLAENVWASRRTNGGFEMRKRYGFSPLTKDILGGGTLAAGRHVSALNDELLVNDGEKLYSYSTILQKWIPRGKVQGISADLRRISGDEGLGKVNVVHANAGGYACYVSSPEDGASISTAARIYLEDTSTGEIVFAETFGSGVYKARVVALGTRFFVFSWNGAGVLAVRTLDPAAALSTVGPTTVSSSVGTLGLFDVGFVNGGIVVAYQSTAPGLSMHTVSNAATPTIGSAVTYDTIDPNECIGFLEYGNGNGNGYLGVGLDTGASNRFQAHVLTFTASSLAVTLDTTLEATNTRRVFQIGGYFSTVINAAWSSAPSVGGDTYAWGIRGYSNGTLFDVMLGLGLASKPFKVGTKWYFVAAYQSAALKISVDRQRTLLLELDQDATSGVSVAGYLMANDSAGHPLSYSCLPSASTISSGRVMFAACGVQGAKADTATVSARTFSVVQIMLDWAGPGLGRPVVHDGVLQLPGACPRSYDGHYVTEAGFLVSPDAPHTLASTTGGGMTAEGTYQYCVVWERTDKTGRLLQSAPGPVATVVVAAGHSKVTGTIPTLRVTETDPFYNSNANVTDAVIALYRTAADLPVFYRVATLKNEPRSQSINFADTMADETLENNDPLYTTNGELDHIAPPAVKVLHKHGERLWAITGDQSVWHSKKSAEGFATGFSDDLRLPKIEQGEGAPLALATVDTTLAIFKRNRTFLLAGDGPDEKGNGPFGDPKPLGTDAGAVSAAAVMETDGGVLAKSPKGWQFLGRDLSLQQIEALADYDALVPAFGAAVDGRPLAVIPTNGAALVWNWQFGQFYTWTRPSSALAGVAAARWRGNLVILQSDGTILQEVVGQYFDGTSTAIAMALEAAWIEGNVKIYRALVTAECKASTTVTTTLTRNLKASTAVTRSHTVTTATTDPLVHAPSSGDCTHVKVRIDESSATEGVRITKFDLEVGLRPGAAKNRTAAYGT